MYWCYILKNDKNNTYCGYTTNPKRRIRQHNGEIVGGAKYTKSHGNNWEFMVLITGFETNNNALSCEWKLKHPNGKKKYTNIDGKIESLNIVLKLDSWTSKCQILNSTCKYTVYALRDIYPKITINEFPENITIVPVDDMNEIIKNLECT